MTWCTHHTTRDLVHASHDCHVIWCTHHTTRYTILTDTFVPGKLPRKRKAQYQRKFPPTAKRYRQTPGSTRPTYSRNSTTNAHPANKTHRVSKTRPSSKRHPTSNTHRTTSIHPSPTKQLKRLQQKGPRTGRQWLRPSQSQRNSEQREPLVKFTRMRRRGQGPKTAPHGEIKKRSAGQVFRKRAKAL